jgi:hypothetical protein
MKKEDLWMIILGSKKRSPSWKTSKQQHDHHLQVRASRSRVPKKRYGARNAEKKPF